VVGGFSIAAFSLGESFAWSCSAMALAISLWIATHRPDRDRKSAPTDARPSGHRLAARSPESCSQRVAHFLRVNGPLQAAAQSRADCARRRLVLHHRTAADHFQIGDFCQIGENFVLHSVDEEFVLFSSLKFSKKQDAMLLSATLTGECVVLRGNEEEGNYSRCNYE